MNKMSAENSSDCVRNDCSTHGSKLKYFCKTHKLFGCGDCMFLEHKSCTDVSDITAAINNANIELLRIRKSLSEEKDKLAERKTAVKAACNGAIGKIDDLKESLHTRIADGLFDYKRSIQSKEKEMEQNIETKLKDLNEFDEEVQSVINRLSLGESKLNFDDVSDCCERSKRYEVISRKKIDEVVVLYDFDFVPSDISKRLLERTIDFGFVTERMEESSAKIKSNDIRTDHLKGGEMQTLGDTILQSHDDLFKPDTIKHKLVQTTDIDVDTDKCNDILNNLSKIISRIKKNGHEVVMCSGKLIIAEKDKLRSFDFGRKEYIHELKLNSSPSNLITIGNKYLAVILRKLNVIECYKVEENGTLEMHRRYSDDNTWTEILTIAEGINGYHILATIKSFETSDFKHPTTLTRLHILLL